MKTLASFYFLLLKLRYKFEIIWLDTIDKNKKYVLLPNHQALVDPQIVVSLLSTKIALSPVMLETYYNLPVLKNLFKMLGAISIWDIQRGSGGIEDVKNAFKNIEITIKNGKNILVYPSGQLYCQWFEVIRGKKIAYNLIQILPEDTEILVIKTTGLWWSMWSKAWEGDTPNFLKTFLKAIFIVISNAFFLIPKRNVKIEIQNYTQQLKSVKDINIFNQTLENFYNKDGEEIIKYKKHFLYFDNIKTKKEPEIIAWSIKELSMSKSIDESIISNETKEKIIEKIAEIKKIEKEKISIKSNLINDLFFDSLDLAEIKASIQGNFEWASNPPILDLKTVWDLCIMALWKSEQNEALKPCHWTDSNDEEKTIYEILTDSQKKLGKNISILSLFKENFKKNKENSFVYDTIFWIQSKKDFILKAYLIADYLKKFEGKYIWIMLPSISSASLMIIASYFAWKIPVMLNWTVWEVALLHCVKFANVSTILTSKNFYEKIKNTWTEKLNEKYVFLEDLLKDISPWKKIKALLASTLFFIPKIKWEDEAVLLFTSGSESLPKAVPLSHKNIISDIIWSLYHFPLLNKDILIWFLPPFHSFWFTINTIMPLISSLKVVYTPDPNDARIIANLIKHCGATTLTATPTFLKMILSWGSEEKLKTLKYWVVWAEKAPDNVFELFTKICPNGKILEWYGITECSPVISINPPKKSKKWSVWLAVQWSDIKIISLENNAEVQAKEQWMIYFSWENVFSGYVDTNLESPFEEINGKKYYKTWDLWYLDEEWYLFITWRLKRFIKIAWEMISLPFIEWILNKKYWSNLAIEAREENFNVKIVLFSSENLDLDEIQLYLRQNGVSNLVKINGLVKLESIPVLWTWKIDYKELKNMISFEEKSINFDFSDLEWGIIKKIALLSKIDEKRINLESEFWKDIYLDSIDVWELMVFIKNNFKVYKNIEINNIKNVKDLIDNIK